MISSFVIALGLFIARKNGASISETAALIYSVAATTIVWLSVTLVTPATDDATLTRFYEKTRPMGPGWARVRRATNLPPSPDSFASAILGWTSGVTFVYAGLFGTGSLIYGRLIAAALWALAFVVSGTVLLVVLLRLRIDTDDVPGIAVPEGPLERSLIGGEAKV
jgi:hypothetical protein